MASVVQQKHETAQPEPGSEWRVHGTRLVRPLRGVELALKASEQFNNGNFQLTVKATLETPLSCEQLKRRHQVAWWRTRRALPVVGVVYPTLGEASFELHQTAEDAKRWAAQTCLVEENTTVSDVYLARSRQHTGALTTMTLVVDPIRGPRGYVLNMSHTLMSLDMLKIVREFMSQLARCDAELGIDAIFSPETASSTISRLPQSLSHAYSLRHQPTPQDLQEVYAAQQRSQEHLEKPSIGIPLHPDHQHRPSRTHNKIITFEPSEARVAFEFLKRSGISLTAAFFACMTSGIAHAFPSTGPYHPEPEGAHLIFSVNGRRYLPVTASNGQGPISMPIIPASMWIDAKSVNLHPTSPQGLLRLARVIEQAQNQDLSSPHIIAVFDQLAPALAKGIEDAHNLPGGPPPPPAVGRPTLTSQGQFSSDLDKSTTMTPATGADPIRLADFNSGGRNTDPNVCFALNSFRDELRFNLLFDEKFFDQHDVLHMAYMVARLFRRLVGLETVSVARL